LTLMLLWLALYAATMSVRNASLSRDQKVSVPLAVEAGEALDDEAAAGVLAPVVSLALACGADDEAVAAGVLEGAADFLPLDEHADPSSVIAIVAAPMPTHVCLAFIWSLTFRVDSLECSGVNRCWEAKPSWGRWRG
jgi:hypothetical protein